LGQPRGDSYDNALAESVIGLYKAELVSGRGPWRGCEDLELTTLEWVDWFNRHRLFSSIGYIPPAEYEAMRYPEPVPAGAGTQCFEPPSNQGRFSPRVRTVVDCAWQVGGLVLSWSSWEQ
jgi:hypothetical protein